MPCIVSNLASLNVCFYRVLSYRGLESILSQHWRAFKFMCFEPTFPIGLVLVVFSLHLTDAILAVAFSSFCINLCFIFLHYDLHCNVRDLLSSSTAIARVSRENISASISLMSLPLASTVAWSFSHLNLYSKSSSFEAFYWFYEFCDSDLQRSFNLLLQNQQG